MSTQARAWRAQDRRDEVLKATGPSSERQDRDEQARRTRNAKVKITRRPPWITEYLSNL